MPRIRITIEFEVLGVVPDPVSFAADCTPLFSLYRSEPLNPTPNQEQ